VKSALHWLKYLTIVAALFFVAQYILLALLRISYPFELEWMEGSMVDHVQRVLDGKSLYVPPTIDFVPFAYPPLYFYLSAGLAKVTGIGFLPLRLISLLSSLGALWLIALIVRKETGKSSYGILAAGLFAATYRACGAWLDIGRVDSLLLLLLLGAVYLLRVHDTRRGAAIAGLLLALAVLTKQTAIVVAGPLFLYIVLTRRDLFGWAVTPFMVVAGGALLALTLTTDGWFWYYNVVQPAHHAMQLFSFFFFLGHDLVATMGIATGAAVWWFWTGKAEGKTRLFYGLFVLGMALASLLPRIKAGGFANDLIPIFAALAVLFGLAASRWIESSAALRAPALLYAACLLQFVLLIYNPLRCIPTSADLEAGKALLRKLQSQPGNVLVFSHGFLSAQSAKRPTANCIAVTDVLSAGDPRARGALVKDFREAIQAHRYSALILDDDDPLSWTEIAIASQYSKSEVAIENPVAFWPVSGWPTRPEWIYRPIGK
jgi:4-amino-4-deoxy-L-arabinose transferase-like glycosyltransferase